MKKSELSITKRVLLDYIKFRTNHGFTFYESTNLTLTNAELTRKVNELEDRIVKLENRTTKLENIFYKNGISQEKLEEIIQENEKKDC